MLFAWSRHDRMDREVRMDRLLLKPDEVAQILGLGRTTVYEMIAAGTLPSVRLGRVIRLRWVDVEALVDGMPLSSRLPGSDSDE